MRMNFVNQSQWCCFSGFIIKNYLAAAQLHTPLIHNKRIPFKRCPSPFYLVTRPPSSIFFGVGGGRGGRGGGVGGGGFRSSSSSSLGRGHETRRGPQSNLFLSLSLSFSKVSSALALAHFPIFFLAVSEGFFYHHCFVFQHFLQLIVQANTFTQQNRLNVFMRSFCLFFTNVLTSHCAIMCTFSIDSSNWFLTWSIDKFYESDSTKKPVMMMVIRTIISVNSCSIRYLWSGRLIMNHILIAYWQ